MLRRHLIQTGLAGTISCWASGLPSPSNEAIAWGAAANGLILGLHLDTAAKAGSLIIIMKNVGSSPCDLYVSNGETTRLHFVATASNGQNYNLEDRELYRPCAGLCGFPPIVQRLESGASMKIALAPDNLLYVPANGPYATLAALLDRGFSVQASFQMSEKDLNDGKLLPELPWLGRVKSGTVQKH